MEISLMKAVHPLVKKLFPVKLVARRVKYLKKNWEKLTTDRAIIQIVQGFG